MFLNKNTKKIIANVGWMTFDKVFVLLLNLLVTVKIANYYGASGYGLYQYAVNVAALFEILIKFADGRIVKKQYLNHDPRIVVKTATAARLVFSIISAIAGVFYIAFSRGDSRFKIVFGILLLNGIATNLRFGMSNRFEYLLKSKKVVIAADISLIISSIIQLMAVSVGWSIIAIAVIALITSIINFIIIYIQYKLEFREKSERVIVDRKMLAIILRESLPLAIAASCSTIYSRCDSVMVGGMLSMEDVGVYAIAVKLISIVQIAIHPICESVYPHLIRLYQSDKNAYENFYIRVTSCLTWLYLLGVTASFFLFPVAFKVLKPEYAPAFPVYMVYVIGTFFTYNAALSTGHFAMINKGIILTVIQVISMVSNVILNIFLINCFGLYGAATSTTITNFISSMLAYSVIKDARQVLVWQIKAFNPLRMIKTRNRYTNNSTFQ